MKYIGTNSDKKLYKELKSICGLSFQGTNFKPYSKFC